MIFKYLDGATPIDAGVAPSNIRNHYIQALRAADKNDYQPLITFLIKEEIEA